MAIANPSLETTSSKNSSRRVNRRQVQCYQAIGFFIAITVALSVSLSLFVYRWQAPTTVTFDMAGTLNQFQQQMAGQFNADSPMSEQQIANATQRFQHALSESLTDYQQSHHALILVSPAVVMGADDITVHIQAAIADKMVQ